MQTLPCTYGGYGLAIVGNVIGILVLAAGAWTTFAATGVPPTPSRAGEGDDAVVVQHHDVTTP